MVAGNYIATGLAGIFTEAAHQTGTIAIADGQQVACIDFAASPLTWVIYQFTANLKLVGSILIGIFTLGLVVLNRQKNVIIKK